MTENVEVAVVGTNLEEDVLWTVPLVDYFLYQTFAMIQLEANWSFVPLPARVALNMNLHLIIVALSRRTRKAASGYILLLGCLNSGTHLI
jgi:hypothetical protein